MNSAGEASKIHWPKPPANTTAGFKSLPPVEISRSPSRVTSLLRIMTCSLTASRLAIVDA
jgi:hypothetical protein